MSNHSYDEELTTMRSVKLQTNFCISSSCNSSSDVICRHCSQQYCELCFMCHRKNILDDMHSISDQMSTNRHQGVAEVISFIDKQAKDAHEQAKKLVDDAIDRIVKASKNIYTYIENRRQAKVLNYIIKNILFYKILFL
jgi:transcription termination factor NusB